jgi:glycosyltransferase involved in cell wall biosynthesis
MTMVKAFEGTAMSLKVIGFSSKDYDQRVKEYLKGKQHNIEFLGKQPFEIVKKYLSTCSFTITPSECYDNFPNSILESFAFQKAVVCSDLGSLREMVRHQETGMLFEPGNFTQLREFCLYLFANGDKCKRMGQEGRIWVRNQLSEHKHYNTLVTLFEKLIEMNKRLNYT